MLNQSVKDKPFFTIGLPTYNRPDYAKGAIQSCLCQDYPHFELLISDDSQEDTLGHYVRSLNCDKVLYYHNRPALGMPKKMDDLAEKAHGQWMLILGDDDTFEPSYLSALARALREEPDVALVRTRYRLVDANGRLTKVDAAEKKLMSPSELFASLFRPWFEIITNITGVLYSVERLKQIGGFPDCHQGTYIDRVAWARLGAHGKTYFIDEPLVNIRLFDPSSFLGKFDLNYEACLNDRRKLVKEITDLKHELASQNLSASDREQLDLGWKRFQAFLHDEVHFYLERRMPVALKDKNGDARKDCSAMMKELRTIGLAKEPKFHFFKFLSRLPYWPRVILLSIYRRSRHLKRRLFPVKTFEWK